MMKSCSPKMAVALLFVLSSSIAASAESPETKQQTKKQLASAELGSTRNVHSFGKTLLAGQPSPDDLAEAKRRGIKTVISLRMEGETDWDEAAESKKLGLEFHRFGIQSAEAMNDKMLKEALAILGDKKQSPVLLHCASANRVGAVWLAHRVLNDGITIDEAQAEAKTVGLRSPELKARALEYIKKTQ